LIANLACFIDQQKRGHTPQLKEIPFLSIQVGHTMPEIRQANEWKMFTFPIAPESIWTIRPKSKNNRVTHGKGCILIT